MRIFISWSGADSKAVAEALRTWLQSVIQQVETFVSSQDIGKGARWSTNLTDELEAIDFGLVVLTPTNLAAPWILFETGALSKRVTSRVAPILCNISHSDLIGNPLAQFQYARVEQEDFLKLLEDINQACPKPLNQDILRNTFARWWPDFEGAYRAITFGTPEPSSRRTEEERLASLEAGMDEVLNSTRKLAQQLQGQSSVVRPRPMELADLGDAESLRRMLLGDLETSVRTLDSVKPKSVTRLNKSKPKSVFEKGIPSRWFA